MRKLTKMIILTFLTSLMVIGSTMSAFADSVEGAGSLTINFITSDAEDGISGAGFTLYKIAELNANGSFASYNSDLNVYKKDGESNEEVIHRLTEAATAYYQVSEGSVLTGTTDASGSIVFKDVPYGAYIGINTTPASGYTESEAFLISIPTTVNGDSYVSDVTVSPKPVEKPIITPSIVTNTPTSSPVKTGDDSIIIPYLVFGVTAAVCILLTAGPRLKIQKAVAKINVKEDREDF